MLDTIASFAWTEAIVALLRERYAAGVSAGKIADEFGVTRNAVIGKVHRLGLTRDVTNVAGRPRKDRAVKKPIAAGPEPKEPVPKAPVVFAPARPQPPLAIVRPEPPRPVREPVPVEGVLIHELESTHCRWPLLELPAGQGEEMRYCGAPRITRDGNDMPCPYCDAHARMAYAPRRDANQRAADERRRQAHLQRRRIAA